MFCPGCAGVRRLFARLVEDEDPPRTDPGRHRGAARSPPPGRSPAAPARRDDGFVFAARTDALREGSGLEVEIAGQSCALFRVNGEVHALEGHCPHAGGPLAEGSLIAGVVTCPLARMEVRRLQRMQPRAAGQRRGALRDARRGWRRPRAAAKRAPRGRKARTARLGGSGAGRRGPRKRTPGVRGQAPSE